MTAEEDEIRSQMAALRGSLETDLGETVAGLRTMVDWRQLVRHHPWACLGAAAVAGFAMIPSKRVIVMQPDMGSARDLSRGLNLKLKSGTQGPGAVESVARMLGQVALKAATAYVTRRVTESLSGRFDQPGSDRAESPARRGHD